MTLSDRLTSACVLTLLLTLAQHADLAVGAPDKICDPLNRTTPQGYCGTHLANMISMVCTLAQSSRVTERPVQDNSRRGLMLEKRDALSYLAKRQTTGSIVCECCVHSCDIMEMLQYCDLSNHLYRQLVSNI